MADIDSQQLQRMMDAITTAGNTFTKIAKNQEAADSSRRSAAKKLDDDLSKRVSSFDKNINKASTAVERVSEGFESVVYGLRQFAGGFVGGGAMALMITRATEISKTYRELTNVGQTFGGSMQQMMMAAAAAGLPLNEFARISVKANAVIGQTGNRFFEVQKQLRKNIEANGLYGMSVSQITEYTADYMDVSRQNGSLMVKTTGSTVTELQNLTLQTTVLASASDKTRDEIMKLGMQAATSATAIATIQSAPLAMRGQLDAKLKEATTYMAAQVGEAGNYLSNLVGGAFGSGSAFTSEGKTAIEAGMGQVAYAADNLARKMKDGSASADDYAKFQQYIKTEYENNADTLRALAASGNQAAGEFIKMASQIKVMTAAEKADAAKNAKNQKAFTAFLNSIESIYNRVIGSFNSGFFAGFNKFSDKMNKLGDSKWADRLSKFAEQLGDRFGTFVGSVFTDENIDRIINGVKNVGIAVFSIAESIVKADWLFKSIGTGLSIASKFIGLFTGMISKIDDVSNGLLHNLVGFGIALAIGAKAIKGIKNLFGMTSMSVKAAVVNITGGRINGGDGGDYGDSEGGGRRRRGRFKDAWRNGRRQGGWRGGVKAVSKSLGHSVRGVARGGLGGIGRSAAAGATGLLKTGLRGGLGIGALLEGIDYLSGSKELSMRNLGKSALTVSGSALGGFLGSALGPLGTVGGGAAGYAAGGWLGNALLGDDSITSIGNKSGKSTSGAAEKAATASAAAAGAVAASDMMKADGPVPSAPAPNTDQLAKMVEAQDRMNQNLEALIAAINSKADVTNRMLSKIENNTQGL